jgi:hypothetical protein
MVKLLLFFRPRHYRLRTVSHCTVKQVPVSLDRSCLVVMVRLVTRNILFKNQKLSCRQALYYIINSFDSKDRLFI